MKKLEKSKAKAPKKLAAAKKKPAGAKSSFVYPSGTISVSDPHVRSRLAFAGIGEAELGVIAYWRDVCLEQMNVLVDHFYAYVAASSETRSVIEKHTTVERQRPMLTRYLMTFFDGRIDDAYLELRRRVAARHDEIDLDPVRYTAMYRLIEADVIAAVAAKKPPAEELERFRKAFSGLVQLDVAIVVDSILSARLGRNLKMVEEQQRRAKEFEGVQTAIGRAMATIEFSLDGTVQTANPLFLEATGYSLDEVRGRHHRIFCEPDFANSADYRAFWERLNRGEIETGVIKRLAKGGRELWLQASYNPILDETGKPVKVIKFATDITAQRQAQNEVEAAMAALSEGDLTRTIDGQYQGEYLRIKESINTSLSRLRTAIVAVKQISDSVASSASQLSAGSQSLAQGANEQSSSLQDVAGRLDTMASTTRQSAENAATAKGLADDARRAAERGNEAMKRMSEAIDGIKASSDETAKIVKTIDEIAFQTNLLALNAAVEAARAGEAGKGFAVVAEEVRNLAQRSAEAAKTTAAMIEQSVKSADRGVKLSEEVDKALTEIHDGSRKVDHLVAEIAAASSEQSRGLEALNTAVAELAKVTEQNSANAEESASLAEELGSQAAELAERVGSFQVGADVSDDEEEAPEVERPRRRAREMNSISPARRRRPRPAEARSARPSIPPKSPKSPLNGHAKPRSNEIIPLDEADLADF